jgi:hypothetical protein
MIKFLGHAADRKQVIPSANEIKLPGGTWNKALDIWLA